MLAKTDSFKQRTLESVLLLVINLFEIYWTNDKITYNERSCTVMPWLVLFLVIYTLRFTQTVMTSFGAVVLNLGDPHNRKKINVLQNKYCGPKVSSWDPKVRGWLDSFLTWLPQLNSFSRHGDPNRALLYLNKACSGELEDELMYILRSQCHLKLGHYHSADQVRIGS